MSTLKVAGGLGRPREGAWIEIMDEQMTAVAEKSRPREGAWIEIILDLFDSIMLESPP